MGYQLNLGDWNAIFAVPSVLVDRHLKLAGKEQLQVILWILRHTGEPFTPETLSSALGISIDSAPVSYTHLDVYKRQEVLLLGKDPLKDRTVMEDIGLVLDSGFFPPEMNAKALGTALSSIYRNWDSAAFQAFLSRFEIDPAKKVKEYLSLIHI